MSRAADKIRNVVFVGHSKSGKTSLLEAILEKTGAVPRAGRVDDGSSILDHDEVERERQHTVDPSLAFFEKDGILVNAIDTPGFRDFVGLVFGPLSAVEAVVFLVDADEGVRAHSRKLWEHVQNANLPCLVVINRLDRDNANFEATLEAVRKLSPKCVPLTVPVGNASSLSGVERTMNNEGRSESASEHGEKFMEAVVETNEELLEKYLGGEEISGEDLEKQIAVAVASGDVCPVLSTSVQKGVGIDELIQAVIHYTPSPTAAVRKAHPVGSDEEVEVPAKENDPLCAYVFRTISDPFVGKLTLARVLAGTVAHNGPFVNPHTGKSEKIGKIVRLRGKEQVAVDSVGPGDIVALLKLEVLKTFDMMCSADRRLWIEPPKLPTPMYARALAPKTRTDEKKFSEALTKVTDEDPSISAKRDTRTNQTVVAGLSQLHLQIVINRLKSRFNVEVNVKEPKVPYLETISGKGDNRYRHKKQSGGAGEFAEVALRIEPQERGKGYEFGSEVFGGAISESYVQSAGKGVRAVMEEGVIAGYPMVDIKVTVYDGKEHPVDSKDVAFQKAGREAFKAAVQTAKPAILEPIVDLEVTFQSDLVGDITGDLNRRRARVQGMEPHGDFQTIKAQVPLAELTDYANSLGSMTAGQGSYEIEMSHYEVAPANVQQKIIEQSKAELEKKE